MAKGNFRNNVPKIKPLHTGVMPDWPLRLIG